MEWGRNIGVRVEDGGDAYGEWGRGVFMLVGGGVLVTVWNHGGGGRGWGGL